MTPPVETFRPEPGSLPAREAIPARYTWDLTPICRDWDEWTERYDPLDAAGEAFKARQGTLVRGSAELLAAVHAMDEVGALGYRVWYFASLQYDQDQRNNEINARRQQVQILFAREQQAGA